MLHLTRILCLLSALLSAYTTLATSLPQYTPPAELDPRQLNPGVNPGAAAATVATPANPVTVYNINTQIGTSAVNKIYTYTQIFAAVPDQWPSAQAGTIGLGTLAKRGMVEAQETVTGSVMGVAVMVQEIETVTQEVVAVEEVVIVRELLVYANGTANNGTAFNGTAFGGNGTQSGWNGTASGSHGTAALRNGSPAAIRATGLI